MLLPVDEEQRVNISILRTLVSEDGKVLTIFLKDVTFVDVQDKSSEMFDAGRIAICEKMPTADFYIATVYHAWFIVENDGLS